MEIEGTWVLVGWLQKILFSLSFTVILPGMESFFLRQEFNQDDCLTLQRSGGFNRLDSIIFEFRLKAFQETLG